jgi:AraC-like DNA-binding protein
MGMNINLNIRIHKPILQSRPYPQTTLMDSSSYHISSDIKMSLSHDTFYHTEALLEHHLLVWVIAGQTRVVQANGSTTFDAGSTFILSHNQVVRLVNRAVNGGQYKALAVQLSRRNAKEFYSPLNIIPSVLAMDITPLCISSHPLLDGNYRSLVSLYDRRTKLTEEASAEKIFELLQILRETIPQIDNVLSSFETPGKNDLARFMEGHFIFNITIEEFSYFTGRSPSAFNRDFRNTFGMPPQKWLTKKRLTFAHQQLTTFMKKPVDVYREVGFADLSHFSYAFKKMYGYPPKEASHAGR